jgi:hypothetical protein
VLAFTFHESIIGKIDVCNCIGNEAWQVHNALVDRFIKILGAN